MHTSCSLSVSFLVTLHYYTHGKIISINIIDYMMNISIWRHQNWYWCSRSILFTSFRLFPSGSSTIFLSFFLFVLLIYSFSSLWLHLLLPFLIFPFFISSFLSFLLSYLFSRSKLVLLLFFSFSLIRFSILVRVITFSSFALPSHFFFSFLPGNLPGREEAYSNCFSLRRWKIWYCCIRRKVRSLYEKIKNGMKHTKTVCLIIIIKKEQRNTY